MEGNYTLIEAGDCEELWFVRDVASYPQVGGRLNTAEKLHQIIVSHPTIYARLRALHRRSSGREHSAVIIYGAFECHVKARTAFRENRHLPLSPKEFALFRYFMENGGEIVTREMLLRDVWQMNFDPQTNVVDVNVGRLRRKLEEGFDKPALETIWGSGYRLLDGR